MYIHFSYDKSFEKLMLDLEDTYPKDFIQLNGISDDYLDISKYSQNYFFKKHTADTTIDSNANVQSNVYLAPRRPRQAAPRRAC